LIQEAEALGIHEEPWILEKLNENRDKQALSRWVRENYKPDIQVPEDTVWSYFLRDFFKVQFRVATFKSAENAGEAHSAIRNGADMDSVARVKSVDPYRNRGGLRNPTWYAEMEPVLRDLNDSLAVGELSDPFPYRSVHALARIEQRLPTDTADFEDARGRIERWLKKRESARAWKVFVDEQKDRVGVEVDSMALGMIRADSGGLFTQGFSQGSDRVVVRLGDGSSVTDEELRREIGHAAMTAGTLPFNALLSQSLDDIVEERVLLAAALTDGYDELPVVLDTYNRSMDSALVETYIQETVAPRITFRRDEFETYYQGHLDEFTRPARAQFDRMIVDSASVAIEIYERLGEGADFQYLARQYGVRLAKPTEVAEWLSVTTFPDTVQREINALRIGECTSPQHTTDGWLILKLKAREPGGTLPLEEVETRIRSAMFQSKFNEELDNVIALLKENSVIEYNEEAIDQYFGSGS
jgi:peptidyl-prolyl cis-trans isomerase C